MDAVQMIAPETLREWHLCSAQITSQDYLVLRSALFRCRFLLDQMVLQTRTRCFQDRIPAALLRLISEFVPDDPSPSQVCKHWAKQWQPLTVINLERLPPITLSLSSREELTTAYDVLRTDEIVSWEVDRKTTWNVDGMRREGFPCPFGSSPVCCMRCSQEWVLVEQRNMQTNWIHCWKQEPVLSHCHSFPLPMEAHGSWGLSSNRVYIVIALSTDDEEGIEEDTFATEVRYADLAPGQELIWSSFVVNYQDLTDQVYLWRKRRFYVGSYSRIHAIVATEFAPTARLVYSGEGHPRPGALLSWSISSSEDFLYVLGDDVNRDDLTITRNLSVYTLCDKKRVLSVSMDSQCYWRCLSFGNDHVFVVDDNCAQRYKVTRKGQISEHPHNKRKRL